MVVAAADGERRPGVLASPFAWPGAVANVPNFSTTPQHRVKQSTHLQTRPYRPSVARPRRAIALNLSASPTPSNAHHVFCTDPRNIAPLGLAASPPRRRLHPSRHCARALTTIQMLKTRRKKNVKKGIQFCLMVCGASGTGACRAAHRARFHQSDPAV